MVGAALAAPTGALFEPTGGTGAASPSLHSCVIWSLQLWDEVVRVGAAAPWGAEPSAAPYVLCPRGLPRAVGQQRNAALRWTVPTFPMGKLRHGNGLLVSTMGWVFTLPQDSNHISLALSLILRAFFHQERQKPSPTSSYSCSGPDSSGGIGQWKECQTRAELTLLGFYSPNHPL